MLKKITLYCLIILLVCSCGTKRKISNDSGLLEQNNPESSISDIKKSGLLFSEAKIYSEPEKKYTFQIQNIENDNKSIKCINVLFISDLDTVFYTFTMVIDEILSPQQIVDLSYILDDEIDETSIKNVDYLLLEQC